jgi:hypothetical protein
MPDPAVATPATVYMKLVISESYGVQRSGVRILDPCWFPIVSLRTLPASIAGHVAALAAIVALARAFLMRGERVPGWRAASSE